MYYKPLQIFCLTSSEFICTRQLVVFCIFFCLRKKVASTHGNHNVYVTDLNTGKNVNTLSGHPRSPWCIAFHPSSNQILASGCLGGQVRVWDLHVSLVTFKIFRRGQQVLMELKTWLDLISQTCSSSRMRVSLSSHSFM